MNVRMDYTHDHGLGGVERRPSARSRARCRLAQLTWAGWMLASAGCREEPNLETETSGSTAASESSATSMSSSSITTTAMASTSAVDDSGDATRGATTVPFMLEPDVPGPRYECDVYAQDCPPGEKCTLWASDGGSSANASKCVLVVDDPVGTGEPCQIQGTPLSGLDDCERGDYCFNNIDSEALDGICVPFCVGDASSPYCEDPFYECIICSDSCLPLCLPMCSPLAQDCGPGQACYPIQDTWHCAPDASGDQGGYGDPCEFINVCDPGLICLDSSTVPNCAGSAGCCTEVCDLDDPAGDLQCAGAAEGQTCQPWYGDGSAPRGHENVGACALP